jgi:hypothetical protein
MWLIKMTINDEILILANQLANAGKKPTVAMIKGKLSKQVTLPVIISTLKVWKHDPNFISLTEKESETKEESNPVTDTDKFKDSLHDELVQMKQEIKELKQMIKQLIEQQKC